MSFALQDTAWHRSVGQLAEALDAPDLRIRLIHLLEQYVPFDSWAALLLSQSRPQVFIECLGADGGPDPLFWDYLRSLYLFDPFYITSRKDPCSGLFRLADVAPECLEQTDYYQHYFRLSVVTSEIQINAQLSGEHTLYLSFGSWRHFIPEQLAVLGLVRPWVAGLTCQRLAFEDEVLNSPATPEPDWRGLLKRAAEQIDTPLTTHELEVGRLMLSGCSSKEIARRLAISAEIMKVHREHMYGKLDIKSQSELLDLFLQTQGWRDG